MWTSTEFITYKKQYDFSSSEQGKPTYTVLGIGGGEFINMIELIEGTIDEDCGFQSIICNQCGQYKCESGNWMTIRSINNYVIFIPDFENLNDKINLDEFDPPKYLKAKGAYYLTWNGFQELCELVPEFAAIQKIPELTKEELISLYKWDTPQKMFGNYPVFDELHADRILAVSELEIESVVELINHELNELSKSEKWSIENIKDDKILTIYLDDPSITEWKAMCKTDRGYELLLGGLFKITKSGYT